MEEQKKTDREDKRGDSSSCDRCPGGVCYEHYCGFHRHHSWRVLKIIVVLFAVGIAFAAGAAIGKLSILRYGVMGYGANLSGDYSGMYGMMSRLGTGRFMMGGWNSDDYTRVLGSITKIDGNKITISDNGGAEKVVVSQSNTSITSAGKEIGLSSLKIGETLSAAGTVQGGQFMASWIEVTAN